MNRGAWEATVTFFPPNFCHSSHNSLLLSSLLQRGPSSCFSSLYFSPSCFLVVSSHKLFFKFFYLKDFINRYPKKYTKHEVFSVYFFQLCTEGKVKKKKSAKFRSRMYIALKNENITFYCSSYFTVPSPFLFSPVLISELIVSKQGWAEGQELG